MTKKIFAMFLAVLMVVSMLPASVLAAEATCPGEGKEHNLSNCNSYTVLGVTAPNCGEKGYTTYQCNTCEGKFVASFTDPVGEHVWEDAEDKAPTCENKGSTGGKECTVCGTLVGATEVPALGVGLKCEYSAWAPAKLDLTVGGVQTRTCVHCGNVQKNEIKAANALSKHELGGWELKTPATAEANGLAVRECTHTLVGSAGVVVKCSHAVEQVVFFDHDHDALTLITVDAVAAECNVAGVAKHYVCRVCDGLFAKETEVGKDLNADGDKTDANLVAVSKDALVVASKHDVLKGQLSCITTTLVCDSCSTVIQASSIEHVFKTYKVNKVPTCTTDGYQSSTCEKCGVATDTKIISKLGHIEATVSVPAACNQYAYTFTYCLRDGCQGQKITSKLVDIKGTQNDTSDDISFNLSVGSVALNQPVVGVPFLLHLNKDKTLYFKGTKSGNYLATTEKSSEAVKVYLEVGTSAYTEGSKIATETYRMYFMNGDTKTYIRLYEYQSGKVGVTLSTDVPTEVYTWNSTYGVLTYSRDFDGNGKISNKEEFYLGTYGSYETFSASRIEYLEGEAAGQYPAKMTAINTNGVYLLSITPNVAGGFDSTNHTWKDLTPDVVANCLSSVVKLYQCTATGCGVTKTETLAKLADHDWSDPDTTDSITTDKYKAADCVSDGLGLSTCQSAGCNATKDVVIPATGHKLAEDDDGIVVKEHKGSHTDLVTYKYNICENSYCPDKAIYGEASENRVNKTSYGVWADAGKLWDRESDAKEAHGNVDLVEQPSLNVAGDCVTVGYKAYKCGIEGCNEIIRVKIAGTGAHVAPEGTVTVGEINYNFAGQAATCTSAGYSVNYKCTRCNKFVNESQANNKVTIIPAYGHTWKEFTSSERSYSSNLDNTYVKSPCNYYTWDNWTHYCEVCFKNSGKNYPNQFLDAFYSSNLSQDAAGAYAYGIKADQAMKEVKTSDNLCTATIYEFYSCHCGETHMRSFLQAGVNVDHNWVEFDRYAADGVTPANDFVAPTCTTFGQTSYYCSFCNPEAVKDGKEEATGYKKEQLAKAPHENAAEEKFTNSCLDDGKVTDRHCVLCCQCKGDEFRLHSCLDLNGDGKTSDACACVIRKNQHVWDAESYNYVDSICGDAPYYSRICSVCLKTEAKEADQYVADEDDDGDPIYAPITNLSHKPVEAEAEGERFASYTYVDNFNYYKYLWYALNAEEYPEAPEWALSPFVARRVETYTAKFIEYTAPTYTAEGYAKFLCADCGQIVEEVLPKKSGLGFELKVENANGQEGITFGSLIAVTVSVNALNEAISTFNFDVDFYSNMKGESFNDLYFVGYEVLNENFIITVTDPTRAYYDGDGYGYVNVNGRAVNDASGKKQNVIIEGETELVKLYFRVAIEEVNYEKDMPEFTVEFDDYYADAQVWNAEKNKFEGFLCSSDVLDVDMIGFIDFNMDEISHITDLYLGMDLLTGEDALGRTYSAALDMDKDGVLTPEDLTIAAERLVGSYELLEMLFMGVSESEGELLLTLMNMYYVECNNSQCDEMLAPGTNYCPECGNRQ